MFEMMNEKKTTERKINTLRQIGFAADYATQFQKYVSLTKWENDDVLMSKYYLKLKNFIKNELARTKSTKNLKKMIQTFIRINEKM